MIHIQVGIITHILDDCQEVQLVTVEHEGKKSKAMNFPLLTKGVKIGDKVLINTTAVDLDLGTGGCHFILYCLDSDQTMENKAGHIMKLNYTPLQFASSTCEEQTSPFHDLLSQAESISGMPVLIGELHSMLPIAVTYLKTRLPSVRIAYLMTDRAALPLAFSNHARILKKLGWLEGTITIGQAFGGDLEAINIYTGLLAAKHILKVDLTIVIMGPGLIGTGTKLGFSGMEQVENVHAVHSLGGVPILIPRISEGDMRVRHRGLSHHTQSVLEHLLVPVHFPLLKTAIQDQEEWRLDLINKQKLHFFHEPIYKLAEILTNYPTPILTMGRSFEQDPLFFQTVALAAEYSLRFMDC
jgi:hypothetical protein